MNQNYMEKQPVENVSCRLCFDSGVLRLNSGTWVTGISASQSQKWIRPWKIRLRLDFRVGYAISWLHWWSKNKAFWQFLVSSLYHKNVSIYFHKNVFSSNVLFSKLRCDCTVEISVIVWNKFSRLEDEFPLRPSLPSKQDGLLSEDHRHPWFVPRQRLQQFFPFQESTFVKFIFDSFFKILTINLSLNLVLRRWKRNSWERTLDFLSWLINLFLSKCVSKLNKTAQCLSLSFN